MADIKWRYDQSFVWNGLSRFRAFTPAVTNPGLGAREAEHGHMELEFPGPMPDHLGVPVTVADYTRVDQHGHKHGVINSAFNVLDQEHVFTAYFKRIAHYFAGLDPTNAFR